MASFLDFRCSYMYVTFAPIPVIIDKLLKFYVTNHIRSIVLYMTYSAQEYYILLVTNLAV